MAWVDALVLPGQLPSTSKVCKKTINGLAVSDFDFNLGCESPMKAIGSSMPAHTSPAVKVVLTHYSAVRDFLKFRNEPGGKLSFTAEPGEQT